MSGGHLEDDYVAELLKKDAKASSSRYAAVGLQAFLPKRPTGNAPKPNTRFLRNILRETDTHNAALLAKEAEESRARLRALREGEAGRGNDQRNLSKKEPREERVRDELQRPPKRRRVDEEHERDSRRRRHRDRESDQRRSQREILPHGEDRRERKRRHEEEDDEDRHRRVAHRSHHHRSDRDRHRSDFAKKAECTELPNRKSRRERSVTLSRSRSRSPGKTRSHRRPRRIPRSPTEREGTEEGGSKATSKQKKKARSPSPASDSDPLEAIIGPAPPSQQPKVRSRGRGAFSSSSAIDAHFAASYDPSQDVHPDSELEDDWDQALEALRDRQRWMQQGAERMKAAGFTDDEIKKWERGGEKKEEDVRWSKNGEGREWDRGKVVDDDGHVNLRPEWGRLKGT